MKAKKTSIPKLNGSEAKGEAHLQPDDNHWIGVFVVSRDLLEEKIEQWVSLIINYEGFFRCNDEQIHGRSKAQITHVRPKKEEVVINVKGIEEPTLSGKFGNKPCGGYNENLPAS